MIFKMLESRILDTWYREGWLDVDNVGPKYKAFRRICDFGFFKLAKERGMLISRDYDDY